MKIKVNIPGFGERYCSSDVEYKLFFDGEYYQFYKKRTNIRHNECGPAYENKNGSYKYFINGKLHRLSCYSYYIEYSKYKTYDVIGKYLLMKEPDVYQRTKRSDIKKWIEQNL